MSFLSTCVIELFMDTQCIQPGYVQCRMKEEAGWWGAYDYFSGISLDQSGYRCVPG